MLAGVSAFSMVGFKVGLSGLMLRDRPEHPHEHGDNPLPLLAVIR